MPPSLFYMGLGGILFRPAILHQIQPQKSQISADSTAASHFFATYRGAIAYFSQKSKVFGHFWKRIFTVEGFKQIIWDSTDFHGQLNEGPTEGLDGSDSRGVIDV